MALWYNLGMKIAIPCVIFAGGKSSRMGKDKALLPFEGKSLAQYQYDKLSKIFKKVYISTKEKKFDFDAPLILDSSKIYAPTPAFLDIFNITESFFALSVDTPFVTKAIIQKIFEEAQKYPNKDAIIAKTDFPHPLIGIYNRSILPHIQKALKEENYKLNAILQKAKTHFVEFEDEESFFNLNHPKEYERALQKQNSLL